MITPQGQHLLQLTIRRSPHKERDGGAPKLRHSPMGRGRKRRLLTWGMPLLLIFVFGLPTAKAQDQHKRKVPIVDKLAGGNKQAFSGKVETLDMKHHVLELNATESKSLEIFPVKKGISVTSAEGARMNLTQLKPGNNVIIYYEEKGDRRTINNIVLLTTGHADKPKK